MTDTPTIAPRRLITPAPFQPISMASAGADSRSIPVPLRAITVLLVLALAAVGLLLMLPRWTPPTPVAVDPAPARNSPANTSAEQVSAALPLDDEQATAGARRDAQDLLRATLTRLARLQASHVERWDRSGLHGLQEALSSGEKAYRETRYRAAQDAYRIALTQADQIDTRLPLVIARLLKEGDRALAAGNSAQADSAFGEVLAIRPEHREATLGRARAATLDRVLALVEQAEAYEQMGEEDKARAVYKDAAKLDEHTASVKAGRARLASSARARQLRTALSAGHLALARGDFNAARRAFQDAATLDDASAEVVAGQRETERRAAAAAIAAALDRATRAQSTEAWREAARSYGAALALDGDLSGVADRKRAAEQRAQLDEQLDSLRKDASALTEQNQRELAHSTLARAQAIATPGPRLRAQISALRSALELARAPLEVTLLSDGEAEVALDGIGSLGHFSEHRLDLLPGRYRALVRRAGHADVRIEFSLMPGASAPRISLQGAP